MSASSPDISTNDDTVTQDDSARERSRELSRQSLMPPSRVPGYEIIRCLGEGSFGSVWLAREANTGKQVAIKFYSHRRGLDWSLLSREVEKLAVLYTSRNVVGLLDVGWDHDPPFFVMEYLEQGSLADRLKQGPLPVEEAVQITKSVARALVQAHGSGILHCDVKPANVLLDGNQEPRLADFGQSRLTDDQSPALGTLFYMAPEQADLEAIPNARWDVYALGALLYHMLCGHPPYRTERATLKLNSEQVLSERLTAYREIINKASRPDSHRQLPTVDRALADIVDRCLDPDPQRRFRSTQSVVNALDAREQSRAKRPLILLGFLGPLLFLTAMGLVAQRAVPDVVEAAEKSQITLALDRDEVAATLLADSLEKELRIRLDELQQFAKTADVRDFLAKTENVPSSQWQSLGSPLDVWAPDSDDRLREQNRTTDISWFITNARGDQVARVPSGTTIGRNFAWRSYFHGGAEERDPTTSSDDISPRTKPGISTAFRSQATNKYMVALAVPIWDADHVDIIGILARTLHLTDLLSRWGSRIRGDSAVGERFLALVDTRDGAGFLLDHHWMTPETLEGRTDDQIERELRLDPATIDELRRKRQIEMYRDPVANLDDRYAGDWLAAFAPVEETGWYAIVQESRAAALRPVGELRRVFTQYGIWALVVFSLMLGILWYLIHRASMT